MSNQSSQPRTIASETEGTTGVDNKITRPDIEIDSLAAKTSAVRRKKKPKTYLAMADGLGAMSGPSVKKDGDDVALDVRVREMMETMGRPREVRPDKRSRMLNTIYSRVGARTAADKLEVDQALTYLVIVHTASPEVRWKEEGIELIVSGFPPVPMEEIVDVVGRDHFRRFMVGFSELAIKMHDASPELRSYLQDRAVGSGLATTSTLAVIDFLSSVGAAPSVVVDRVTARGYATNRVKGPSKQQVSARGAAAVVGREARAGESDALGEF